MYRAKGMPAALLMASLQSCFRTEARNGIAHPAETLRAVNRQFYALTEADRFATLFFGVYDDATRRLRYINCGHCPPLVRCASGAEERLDPTASLLGAFADWDCAEAEIHIAPGDTVLLYSDGVTESTDALGDEFGEERLAKLLGGTKSALEMTNQIVREITSGWTSTDDATIAVLRGV
ncbi:MAG: PP2C family protein-serine/threonine phosphatase [Acidobacteriota bacterium]